MSEVQVSYGNKRKLFQDKLHEKRKEQTRARKKAREHAKHPSAEEIERRLQTALEYEKLAESADLYLKKCCRRIHYCDEQCANIGRILNHKKECTNWHCILCETRDRMYNHHLSNCAATADNSFCIVCNEYDNMVEEHKLVCKDTATNKICKRCRRKKRRQVEHHIECEQPLCLVPFCVVIREREGIK
jgi:hypothetical protein